MTNNVKRSRIIAILALFMLAVIPAVAAWSQLPTKSNFVFAAETPVTKVGQDRSAVMAPGTSIAEVEITAPIPKLKSNITSHSVSVPITCHLHELDQQGSPTARYVRVCG